MLNNSSPWCAHKHFDDIFTLHDVYSFKLSMLNIFLFCTWQCSGPLPIFFFLESFLLFHLTLYFPEYYWDMSICVFVLSIKQHIYTHKYAYTYIHDSFFDPFYIYHIQFLFFSNCHRHMCLARPCSPLFFLNYTLGSSSLNMQSLALWLCVYTYLDT